MESPIRVLQILGILAGGGVESVVRNYYEHIDRKKIQFDFVVHNDSQCDITDAVEMMGGKVYKVLPYYKNPIGFVRGIYSVVKANDYNIVHSNMNTLSAFALFAAWMAGAPVRILHNHSTSSPGETKRNIMKYILRPFARLFANRYLACSRLAAEWMYGRQMVENNKVKIINNAVELQKYAFDSGLRENIRQRLWLEDKFVIGHVGRFMFQKNHSFLLDIFAEVHKRHEDTVLLLIGDGPLKSQMEDKVKALGLADSVRFMGLRNDVQDLYNAMDLFVLPSHYEGLPVVGVEAQANGLPILVSTDVTKETELTSVIKFKPLDDGAASWADEIDIYYEKRREPRMDTVDMMRQAGFDIFEEAKKLELYYQQIVNETGIN